MRQATVIAATLAGPVAAPVHAAPSTTDAWQFQVTPYLFGAALSGTTGIGNVTADVDLSFGDILDNLDSGFMAMLEARKGRGDLVSTVSTSS
jgi:hypothetical protein